jgi:hypothetical protein
MLLGCMTMTGAFQAHNLFDHLSTDTQRHQSIEQ